MHSSVMRTARLLTVSQHVLDGEGVFAQVGSAGGGCGRHPTGPETDTPLSCGQTDTCENITFANFVCGR